MLTLERVTCMYCNKIVGYVIRCGPDHFKYGDPYTVSGFVGLKGEIRGVSGVFNNASRRWLKDALTYLGIKGWWKRIKGDREYKKYL